MVPHRMRQTVTVPSLVLPPVPHMDTPVRCPSAVDGIQYGVDAQVDDAQYGGGVDDAQSGDPQYGGVRAHAAFESSSVSSTPPQCVTTPPQSARSRLPPVRLSDNQSVPYLNQSCASPYFKPSAHCGSQSSMGSLGSFSPWCSPMHSTQNQEQLDPFETIGDQQSKAPQAKHVCTQQTEGPQAKHVCTQMDELTNMLRSKYEGQLGQDTNDTQAPIWPGFSEPCTQYGAVADEPRPSLASHTTAMCRVPHNTIEDFRHNVVAHPNQIWLEEGSVNTSPTSVITDTETNTAPSETTGTLQHYDRENNSMSHRTDCTNHVFRNWSRQRSKVDTALASLTAVLNSAK